MIQHRTIIRSDSPPQLFDRIKFTKILEQSVFKCPQFLSLLKIINWLIAHCAKITGYTTAQIFDEVFDIRVSFNRMTREKMYLNEEKPPTT